MKSPELLHKVNFNPVQQNSFSFGTMFLAPNWYLIKLWILHRHMHIHITFYNFRGIIYSRLNLPKKHRSCRTYFYLSEQGQKEEVMANSGHQLCIPNSKARDPNIAVCWVAWSTPNVERKTNRNMWARFSVARGTMRTHTERNDFTMQIGERVLKTPREQLLLRLIWPVQPWPLDFQNLGSCYGACGIHYIKVKVPGRHNPKNHPCSLPLNSSSSSIWERWNGGREVLVHGNLMGNIPSLCLASFISLIIFYNA